MDVPEEGSVAEFLRAGAKKAAPVDEKPVLLHRKADADVERKLDAATMKRRGYGTPTWSMYYRSTRTDEYTPRTMQGIAHERERQIAAQLRF